MTGTTHNRYGPQTVQIEALLDRVRTLSDDEAQALADARHAAWDAQDAAWAAWDAAWDAVWLADRVAAQLAVRAAWDAAAAAAAAVLALIVRDLIGQHGFTQTLFDTLVGPWESVMGTDWTREAA